MEVNIEISDDNVEADVTIENVVVERKEGIRDYNLLDNLPMLNGEVIKGNMKEKDPTVPEWAKQEKKPEYQPEEIGAIGVEDEMTLEDIISMMNSVFN